MRNLLHLSLLIQPGVLGDLLGGLVLRDSLGLRLVALSQLNRLSAVDQPLTLKYLGAISTEVLGCMCVVVLEIEWLMPYRVLPLGLDVGEEG